MPAAKPASPLTLTQVASFMRKFIAIAGVTLAVMIVGRVFLESAVGYWKATHPAPPPPPTAVFGLLPRLKFPTSVGTATSLKLEIPPSRLRPVSDRATVYFIRSKRPSLLALDKAKEQAATLGFLFEPDRIDTQTYRWRRTQPLTSVLDYDIITGMFTMSLDWQSDPNFLQNSKLPIEDEAILNVRSSLSTAGLLEKDIATGSAQVSYLKSSGGTYEPTVSFSEADFLQIDLYRTPVNGQYQVVTEEPGHGTIRAIITGSSDKSNFFAKLEYYYLPIEYGISATYPIITPTRAFQLLSEGSGYTAAMPTTGKDVIVRNINLAYYDSKAEQQYLQPVYVLTGDGGYVGYVSAIDPRYVVQ
ncbi:MAG TPA: hypothetical protein VLH19_00315 [Patescibacteria group bacterium]|nr:hypothetical protein [Patescibacteria group bacterium]